MSTFFDLKATKNDGTELAFDSLRGKKLIIVNVASACGFTGQYAPMQELYNEFGGENFELLAFPCNDFGAQEPGSAEEIQQFCEVNYGVTFPIMEKVSIKGETHEVYQWLTQKAKNGVEDTEVRWNFQKYLINADGSFEACLLSDVSPVDECVVSWLQN